MPKSVKLKIKHLAIRILVRVFGTLGMKESNITGFPDFYNEWINRNEPDTTILEAQKCYNFAVKPKISIVVPMYNTPIEYFAEMISSVKNQTYTNWELCLGDGSAERRVEVEAICKSDKRIKYKFIGENKGISGNTNEAIRIASGDFIGFMDHDDLLAVFALFEIVKCINENPDAEFIYSDEDRIEDNVRHSAFFKPGFSPDTLRSANYFNHFCLLEKNLFRSVGELDSRYDGAQDYDFCLRAIEKTKNVYHIPKILYHWRLHVNCMTQRSNYIVLDCARRALYNHIKRININGVIRDKEAEGQFDIIYSVVGSPSVSILIPNKDNYQLLKICVDSILELSTYKNYEVIIIDQCSVESETHLLYEELKKNSKIRILAHINGDFNYAKLINFGVKNSNSDFIVQLYSNVQVLTKDWLEVMLGFAQRSDIGAVGGKLFYPDKTIRHAGIILGIGDTIAANAFDKMDAANHMYVQMIQNRMAVTGACLMSRCSLYSDVDYLDERLTTDFYDIDYCLKLRERGLLTVYNPLAEFIYNSTQSKVNPTSNTQYQTQIECFMEKRGKDVLFVDPYYNINLNRNKADFTLAL